MRACNSLALLIVGAVLILGPVFANAYSSAGDKQRIAEFYMKNGNGAILPEVMNPTGYSGYDWACFGIGAAVAFAGVRQWQLGGEPMMKRSPVTAEV